MSPLQIIFFSALGLFIAFIVYVFFRRFYEKHWKKEPGTHKTKHY